MAQSKLYYTLLARGPDDTQWRIEFGDYSFRTVKDECSDMKDGHYCDHRFKIIVTDDTQAAIDAAVSILNSNH